jgi:hypothetical protein
VAFAAPDGGQAFHYPPPPGSSSQPVDAALALTISRTLGANGPSCMSPAASPSDATPPTVGFIRAARTGDASLACANRSDTGTEDDVTVANVDPSNPPGPTHAAVADAGRADAAGGDDDAQHAAGSEKSAAAQARPGATAPTTAPTEGTDAGLPSDDPPALVPTRTTKPAAQAASLQTAPDHPSPRGAGDAEVAPRGADAPDAMVPAAHGPTGVPGTAQPVDSPRWPTPVSPQAHALRPGATPTTGEPAQPTQTAPGVERPHGRGSDHSSYDATSTPSREVTTLSPEAANLSPEGQGAASIQPGGSLTPAVSTTVETLTAPLLPPARLAAVTTAPNLVLIRSASAEVVVPSLGKLSVSAHVRDGVVDARITSTSAAAAVIIPRSAEIAADARAANIPLARLDVVSPGGNAEFAASDGRQPDPQGRPHHPAEDAAFEDASETGSQPDTVRRGRVRIVL